MCFEELQIILTDYVKDYSDELLRAVTWPLSIWIAWMTWHPGEYLLYGQYITTGPWIRVSHNNGIQYIITWINWGLGFILGSFSFVFFWRAPFSQQTCQFWYRFFGKIVKLTTGTSWTLWTFLHILDMNKNTYWFPSSKTPKKKRTENPVVLLGLKDVKKNDDFTFPSSGCRQTLEMPQRDWGNSWPGWCDDRFLVFFLVWGEYCREGTS